jgi:hypothetical protein
MSAQLLWCDRCGEPLSGAAEAGSGVHDRCAGARTLEPPRFCSRCRRRMKVQVLPAGWVAACVEHGKLRPAPAPHAPASAPDRPAWGGAST